MINERLDVVERCKDKKYMSNHSRELAAYFSTPQGVNELRLGLNSKLNFTSLRIIDKLQLAIESIIPKPFEKKYVTQYFYYSIYHLYRDGLIHHKVFQTFLKEFDCMKNKDKMFKDTELIYVQYKVEQFRSQYKAYKENHYRVDDNQEEHNKFKSLVCNDFIGIEGIEVMKPVFLIDVDSLFDLAAFPDPKFGKMKFLLGFLKKFYFNVSNNYSLGPIEEVLTDVVCEDSESSQLSEEMEYKDYEKKFYERRDGYRRKWTSNEILDKLEVKRKYFNILSANDAIFQEGSGSKACEWDKGFNANIDSDLTQDTASCGYGNPSDKCQSNHKTEREYSNRERFMHAPHQTNEGGNAERSSLNKKRTNQESSDNKSYRKKKLQKVKNFFKLYKIKPREYQGFLDNVKKYSTICLNASIARLKNANIDYYIVSSTSLSQLLAELYLFNIYEAEIERAISLDRVQLLFGKFGSKRIYVFGDYKLKVDGEVFWMNLRDLNMFMNNILSSK